jgi:hypothetical protein
VKANRQAAPPENPYRRLEKTASDCVVAALDLYRDLRDATCEALFFQIYGPAAILRTVDEQAADAVPTPADPRELPIVQEALAAIGTGGYPEAMALIGALIGRGAGRIPLKRLELVDRFVRSDDLLSQLSADQVRRIKAEQAVVAELEPERGLQSLTKLLADPADLHRALAVLDEAVVLVELTPDQRTMLDRVKEALGVLVTERQNDVRHVESRELALTT